jgi:integrase
MGRGMFFKLIRQLEQNSLISGGLTFHGLRHTVGSTLTEAGAARAINLMERSKRK